jgi:hypothetical protein
MRIKANSRALSLSAGQANSFICLVEIQAKNVFFRVFASAIGKIFVSDDFKNAFLQHAYRPNVVRWRKSDDLPQGPASYWALESPILFPKIPFPAHR